MDKLEPILRQKFWILAALVLPLAMYGYFTANGAIKAETAARETELDGVKSGVPGGQDISQEYTDKLAKINDAYEKAVDAEVIKLWENQQPRMTWPAQIADFIPKTFQADIDAAHRQRYKSTEYERVLQKLIDSVEPVVSVAEQTRIGGRPQKVWLSGWVPEVYLGPQQAAPTSQEVWDAQMDVWLTQLLFDAVRTMNEGRDSITESVIRRIDRVELVGGDGVPVLSAGAAGAPGAGGSSYEGYGSEMMTPGGDGLEVTGGGFGQTAAKAVISFNPAEEFGPAGGAAAGGYDSYGGAESMTPAMGAAATPALRYIGLTDDAPYMERGFYMAVLIMEKKLPDFVVELANAPWPVRVVRFHIGPNPYAEKQPAGGTGGYGPMATGPGYGTELYASEYGDTGLESGLGMEMTPFGGTGGGTMAFGTATAKGNKFTPALKAKYSAPFPPFAQAAMNHPELVMVHLCGVITIYKQPELEAEEAEGENGAIVDEGLPALPEGELPADGTMPENVDPLDPGLPVDPASGVDPADPAAAPVDPATATPEPAVETATESTPEAAGTSPPE